MLHVFTWDGMNLHRYCNAVESIRQAKMSPSEQTWELYFHRCTFLFPGYTTVRMFMKCAMQAFQRNVHFRWLNFVTLARLFKEAINLHCISKVDKLGIQPDRVLCFHQLFAISQFGGCLTLYCIIGGFTSFLSVSTYNNALILNLFGRTLDVVVGTFA